MGVNDIGRGWGTFIDAAPSVYKSKPKSPEAIPAESDDEQAVRRLHSAGTKDAAIARVLGCSASWVSQLRKKLGLRRAAVRGLKWSAGETKAMGRVLALKQELEEEILRVADALGRTPRSVQEKLKTLTAKE